MIEGRKLKHASLQKIFYVKVPNTFLGPNMPTGETQAILHGVYGREGELLLTHLLLESGAHWSGIPLIFLNGGIDKSALQPWGCMGNDVEVSTLDYLEGLRVKPRFIQHEGRHTGIIIDWSGRFHTHPQEHKPLSLIKLDNENFALLPNNYFEIKDKHFTCDEKQNTPFYKRGEETWYED